MKRLGFLFIIAILVGCSYTLEDYVDSPKTILEDPLSVKREEDLANLERKYLNKAITYDEYLKRKRQIEDKFAKDVQGRESSIHDTK